MPQLPQALPRSLMPMLLIAAKASAAVEISAPMTVQFTDPATQRVQSAQSQPLTLAVSKKQTAKTTQAAEQPLALSFSASQREAEIGDLLTFTFSFANHTGATLPRYSINARLAQGFKLVAGSALLDGERFIGVSETSNGRVNFVLSDLAAEQVRTLTYTVRVSASSDGDSLSTAYASATRDDNTTLSSAPVQVKVRAVRQGVVSDEGALFGKVSFPAECQANTLLPIGGVRIYLEDGRYAITDASGDYNFHAVKPGMHTVKLDQLTLPKGSKLRISSNQQLGDASSQFAEMPDGGFQRVDFSAECPQQDEQKVFATVRKFNEKLKDTDVFEQGERKVSPDHIGPLLDDEAAQPAAEAGQQPVWSSRDALKEVGKETVGNGAWLWPKQNTSTDGRFMAALPLAASNVTLYVNGNAIPETQLGEQLGDEAKQVQVASWYGVPLEKGNNTVEVRSKDATGKQNVALKSTFINPGRGTHLEITPELEELPADGGASKVPLKVRIVDNNGNLAAGDYFLTLEASDGRWVEADIQDSTPGHQVRISNGEGVVHLRSSHRTGKVRIKIISEQMVGESRLAQVVYMRPLIATGYLDITAHGGDLADDRLSKQGKVFMKGKIKGGLHLTFAYDSTKHNDDTYNYNTYLQDENDDRYAPARGDGSIRDQDARSKDKLYLKLEKGQHSVMYGDYELDNTEAGVDLDTARLDLARDPRYLTGALAHYGDSKTEVDVFAARQENRRFVELIPGNGTSMNFRVGEGDILPNSAVVELLVRDKSNPGLIVSSTTLTRVVDYTLDDVSGDLRFHRVIPTFDENLNPVLVRISYDRENSDGEQPYTVAGVRVKRAITETISVGGSYTQDDHPTDGHTLSGAYVDYQPDKDTRVSVSSAQMEHANGDEGGTAQRVQASHRWSQDANTAVTFAQADKGFTSSGSGIGADRREARIDHTQALNKDTDLKLEGIHSENISSETIHQAVGARVETRVGEWRVAGGMRHIEQQAADESSSRNTALVAAKRNIKVFGRGGRVAAEYEQDIRDPAFNHAYADAELLVGKDSSIYAKYDHGNDMLGTQGLTDEQRRSVLSVGAKTKVKKDTELYTEYRSEGLFGNHDSLNAETATGVKGNYVVDDNLIISPTLEVVKVNSGDVLENTTAASIAVADNRNTNRQKYLKVEGRDGDQRDYYGVTGSYIAKMSEDWTGVVREELHRDSSAVGATFDNTLTLGAAHRPAGDGKLNSQYLYQWKNGKTDGEVSSKRNTHILSTWQNYRVSNNTSVSGRVAGKFQQQNEQAIRLKTRTGLADASLNVALTSKVDTELRGGIMHSDGGETRYSAGAGVNVNVAEDWRLGVGYNATGFEDKDLDPGKQNAEGPYLRLQGKIGEQMFKAIQPQESPLGNDKLL
ncbi:MAG: DUF11 domain-containing protein [Gammaproteobacteria bacterium]|nr:DUF11 domain-containing protein [Gammaproteobacteria bacterium]MBU1722598.1 DUF11 domain-containing protein [Gammaproteobacteria bacterium]MBU2007070.1 DUF11 domain-containing protein [Gammaproteobacteria bacterium]